MNALLGAGNAFMKLHIPYSVILAGNVDGGHGHPIAVALRSLPATIDASCNVAKMKCWFTMRQRTYIGDIVLRCDVEWNEDLAYAANKMAHSPEWYADNGCNINITGALSLGLGPNGILLADTGNGDGEVESSDD